MVDSIAGCEAYYEELAESRQELSFDIGGIVFKVDDLALQQQLGAVSQAAALGHRQEISGQEEMTVVRGVEVQVGRTGAVTPVARPIRCL